jgi:hypothetical protein
VSILGDEKLGRILFTGVSRNSPQQHRVFQDYRSEAFSSIGESVSKLGDVELGRSLFPVLIKVVRGIREILGNRSRSLCSFGKSIEQT